MRFTPRSEKEIAEANLLPPGFYDFEVFEAEEKISKNNNEMIELKLYVYDDRGLRRMVRDWLVENVPGKLRSFAAAVGLLEDYEQGHLRADDLVGRPGRVKIGIRKDPAGAYPDQNRVLDYVRPEGSEPRAEKPIVEDKIPW
jgi:hypothetical protein